MIVRRLSNRNLILIYALGLFCICFLSKFFFIGLRDICLDEPYSIFHAQFDLKHIVNLPNEGQPNPPLFMILLHYWIKAFGYSPEALRSLPLIFNSLTASIIFLIGNHLRSINVGLLSSVLFMLSQNHFLYGMETRTYAMFFMFTALSIYCFLKFLENPKSLKLFIQLTLVNTFTLYSHYFGIFVLFTQAFVIILLYRKKAFYIRLCISLIISAFTFIPILKVILKQFLQLRTETWLTPPHWRHYLDEIKSFTNGALGFRFLIIIILLGLVYQFFTKKKFQKLENKAVIPFLFWFLPYTIMFLVSWKSPMFMNKYIQFTSIGFYVFISMLIFRMFENFKLISIGFGMILAISMLLNLNPNPTDFYYRQPAKAVNHIKNIQSLDTNTYIIMHPYWINLEFAYHYDLEIFKDINNFEKHLESKNIEAFWGVNQLIEKWPYIENKNIIYYQNASTFIDPEEKITNYLKSKMHLNSHSFFPGTHDVTYFTKGQGKTSESMFKLGLQQKIQNQMEIIKNDKDWLKTVKAKARERNLSLDSMLYLDAKWVIENH